MAAVIERARDAFRRQAWADAYAALSAAAREEPLALEDLERLALAAQLTGRDAESTEALTQAYHECIRLGDSARAARCAFWLGFDLVNRGEMAPGFGWFARASHALDERALDSVERGYLLLPIAFRAVTEGDNATGLANFVEAARIGERFGDRDLVTLAMHGQGRALIRQNMNTEGLALLDEVMVAVTAGEVSPVVAGTVYCSVIDACHEIFDLRRAQEWTSALSQWCDSHPDLVPFRGQCLVLRAEIMRLRGAWPDALEEVRRACVRLSDPPGQPAVGWAFYEQGELHRVRGEFAEAEGAYRKASHLGVTPQPGLALLRLAQGQLEAAEASIRRLVDETRERGARCRMLAAYVEILAAAKDVPAARAGADELAAIAAQIDTPFLHAISAHATGMVVLAEGDARAAMIALRRAWAAWRKLDAPYEAARVRVHVGMACRALADEDTAEMELDAARSVFEQLGAAADLERLVELSRVPSARGRGGLTSREIEVLALVATGKTNRAIAAELVISEKTVARHLSNIFTKLGISSRAAATAYAYEHRLV